MLEEITYFPILGKPLIMYLGIVTLFFLLLTATISTLNRRGIKLIHFKWHPRIAKITITVALIHGALGILAFL
ncbi:MAG: hypothetical protein GTN80_07130 [Nitrososphaeria archaeon]|nr:hypothetical protein [Nitrososphaeria archaeon]NIQ33399.1 hypothetical protein [Nitrososphaeria archaeon]